MNIESPTVKAERIARELDSDPIAARQVKEFISEERLITILECGVSLEEFEEQEAHIRSVEAENDDLRAELSEVDQA